MKKTSLIYSLVGLVVGGTLTGLSFINWTQAQSPTTPHHQNQSTPSKDSGMGMMNQTQKDQHYIQMMIVHHQGAIDMADLALSNSKRPEIKEIALVIKKDQTEEIEKMKNWYKQWYGTEVPNYSNMAMSSNSNNCGMTHMTSTNLEALKNASDFDKMFLEEMIPHHQDAVMMSAMVLNSEHPELRNLAKNVIEIQSAEIEQMRQWLDTWY